MSDEWTGTAEERKSRHRIVVWSLLWVGVFLVVDTLVERGSITGDAAVVVAVVVVSLLGLGWIGSYVGFLRNADELGRKVHLEAVAVALGAGFLAGFALLLLEDGGIGSARPDTLLAVMVIAYAAAVIVGWRRFS